MSKQKPAFKVEQKADRLIGQFIECVGNYLAFRSVAEHASLAVAKATHDNPDFDRIMELSGRKNQEANHIRKCGPALAQTLERMKKDSTGVLKIAHCASGGGGAEAVIPLWTDIKVELQRIAINLTDEEDITSENTPQFTYSAIADPWRGSKCAAFCAA